MADPSRGLTAPQIRGFITNGFVRVDDAFAPDLAAQVRARLWQDLPGSATDPSTWREPVVRLGMYTDLDAPTRIRVGSHRAVGRMLASAGEEGLTLADLVSTDFGGSGNGEEAIATGPAGTVYLCHPFLVHAAQAHRGTTPRFMAQPPLLPVDWPQGGVDPSSVIARAVQDFTPR